MDYHSYKTILSSLGLILFRQRLSFVILARSTVRSKVKAEIEVKLKGAMTADQAAPKLVHPVDKGWAWVVMMVAFAVHFFSVGYERSFGILYVEFQETVGGSSTLASAIIGAKAVSYCLTTLLVMNLALNRISVRTSCMIGCVLQSMGVAATSLNFDPVYIIATQGVLFGIGHGMLYCPTLFILSQYFERYRPITTALATCGASVGGIAFPMITRGLLGYFGLSGTLLILGGVLFHQLAIVALYTPPGDYQDANRPTSPSDWSEKSGNETTLGTRDIPVDDIPATGVSKSVEEKEYNEELDLKEGDFSKGSGHMETKSGTYSLNASKDNVAEPNVLSRSYDNIPTDMNGVRVRSQETNSLIRKACSNRLATNQSSCEEMYIVENHYRHYQHHSKSHEFLRTLNDSINGLHQIHTSMPVLLLLENGQNIHCRPSNQQEFNGQEIGVARYHDHSSKLIESTKMVDDSRSHHSTATSSSEWNYAIPEVMRLPMFWVLLLYFVGGVVGTACPPLYIPSLALEKGLTRADGAYFLMISASTEIVGRFLPGFILNVHVLRPTQLMLIPFSCLAVLYLLTPIMMDFPSLTCLTLAYGLMSSSFWAVQTLVVIEVLGMAYLAPAIGFYAVFMGLVCSAAFPLGGWLQDETGTYSSTFVFLGVMYFIAVASLAFVQLARHRRFHKAKTVDDNIDKDENDQNAEELPDAALHHSHGQR